MSACIFSHRPWSDLEAAQQRETATTRLAARALRNRRINHGLMALTAFCVGLAAVWQDQPSAPWLLAAGAVLLVLAVQIARDGLDPELEVRRWEFEVGYPPAALSRVEALLADATLPAEIPGAIHRWQALGYTLRRRDLDFLLGLAGRTDERSAADDYFNYVLLRNDV